jgi:hypothetical protein
VKEVSVEEGCGVEILEDGESKLGSISEDDAARGPRLGPRLGSYKGRVGEIRVATR